MSITELSRTMSSPMKNNARLVSPLVCLGLEPLAEHAKHEDVRDRCTHDRSDENRKEHSETRVLDACKPHDARIHLA